MTELVASQQPSPPGMDLAAGAKLVARVTELEQRAIGLQATKDDLIAQIRALQQAGGIVK
jgi:hypothetical protein